MKNISLKIATPERVVFQEEIDEITIPTQKGIITVLPGHIPLISSLASGEINIKTREEELVMAVSGGFLELSADQLTILADTAEKAEEIDLERAEEARKKAEEMKQNARKNLDEGQYAAVISNIEKQLARIKVAKRFQRRGKARMNLE